MQARRLVQEERRECQAGVGIVEQRLAGDQFVHARHDAIGAISV